MNEFFSLVVIPIILGVVEVMKRAGFPVKFSPLLSLVLGLFFGIFFIDALKEGIIVGLMVGLSATGLYSGSKNIKEGSAVKSNKNNSV
jgi:L-cystine uptake protein TcyP (sodium:dicarboxylate symporter family)